ncbi:hypothetical protein E2P81_ATG06052 [Venturia nashicola]|uniref:Uncharacterized protein n=1 Tax=Venturia nashicola TaxID=86259 RepID=A0A4Z1PD63_9PEZI|nr:hypothetical protein E6O75_ATG06194 [Venturia nashicola]TLD29758.1 hypothetical protein E2P81_ATG06052 [Venturia nashicola]
MRYSTGFTVYASESGAVKLKISFQSKHCCFILPESSVPITVFLVSLISQFVYHKAQTTAFWLIHQIVTFCNVSPAQQTTAFWLMHQIVTFCTVSPAQPRDKSFNKLKHHKSLNIWRANMSTYMSPFYSWSESSTSSLSIPTPSSSGTINTKVEERLSDSASLADPLYNKPEIQARKREECAGPTNDKTGTKNKTSRVPTARDISNLSDIDVKTRCLTVSSPRPIQGLRDSFTAMSKMTKEDRDECREMAREWSYHDPEIRERVEKILGEQEGGDPREEQE